MRLTSHASIAKSPPRSWRRLIRFEIELVMAIWAFVLCLMGLSLIVKWPSIFGSMIGDGGRWVFIFCGSIMIAAGEWMIFEVAHRVFPHAHPRLVSISILLLWLGCTSAAVIGAFLWIAG